MVDMNTTWRLPTFEDVPITASNGAVALAIAIGTLYCFLGYRTLRFVIILTGFLLAGAVAAALAAWLSQGQIIVVAITGVIGGICGAVALGFLVQSGIFLLGMLGVLVVAMHLTAGRQEPYIPWIVLAAGVAGGFLALLLRRTIVILATAAIGAWLVVSGILFFLVGPGSGPLEEPSETALIIREGWVGVACWALVAAAGAMAQFATRPREYPARKREPTRE
ncbi:MAG: DUF4203 domain-containing protein [Candidatus Hydrogenedentota bacterium]